MRAIAGVGFILLAAPILASAAKNGSDYAHCVQQKQAAARYYCDKAGHDCKAELSAAQRECRSEVKEGLHFRRNGK